MKAGAHDDSLLENAENIQPSKVSPESETFSSKGNYRRVKARSSRACEV